MPACRAGPGRRLARPWGRAQFVQLQNRGREHSLERLHGLPGAAKIQIQRAFLLRVDEDHLESGVVRPAVEFAVHPLDTLLGVVLRVGEEVIQFAPAKRLHDAVVAPALGAVEVVADLGCQFLDAIVVNRGSPMPHVLALAPVRQRVGVVEASGALPALGMVQIGDHGAVVMVGQRR